MKKTIIFIFTMILMISCSQESNKVDEKSNLHFNNEKFKIVSSNKYLGGDYSQPLEEKRWLIQRLLDTTYYAELSSIDNNFNITNELWYNKDVGDTLYFVFIGKYRFFRIGDEFINAETEEKLNKYNHFVE